MGTDCIQTVQTVQTESLADILERVKVDYPTYYRAWNSMRTTYGKESIIVHWRGTHGLLVFIEDTLELENSPTALPQYQEFIKLKRIDASKRFAPDNVLWKISKVATKNILSKEHEDESQFPEIESQYAGLLEKAASIVPQELPSKVELIIGRRTEDKEARLEELFNKSMEGTISKSEEAELDALSKAVVEVKPTVEICSTDVEEFYNKRWSDL